MNIRMSSMTNTVAGRIGKRGSTRLKTAPGKLQDWPPKSEEASSFWVSLEQPGASKHCRGSSALQSDGRHARHRKKQNSQVAVNTQAEQDVII